MSTDRVAAQLRFFAVLLICAAALCGLPLMAVAFKKVGVESMTFGVGLLFLLFGYVGARLWGIAQGLDRLTAPGA